VRVVHASGKVEHSGSKTIKQFNHQAIKLIRFYPIGRIFLPS
jgi:hypothetical protein